MRDSKLTTNICTRKRIQKKKKSKRKDGLSGEDIYSAKLMTMKDNEKKKVYRFPDINKGVRDNQSLLYWACLFL